jgi:endonuclease YncB( thermonuclease family)
MIRALALLAALVLAAHGATGAEAIVGHATVIDGDTLDIHGTQIRLYGVDAPEYDQMCILRGKNIPCGQNAAHALSDKIGSALVTCEPKDRDKNNRVLAVCHSGGDDLNAWMVAHGWAMAYRQYTADYAEEEDSASQANLGIWQGEFVTPWDWRHGKRPEAVKTEPQQPGACLIKGNINPRGEHIYHVPGGDFYDKTVIDITKGERWFCTEEEARAAGWQKSLR